MHMAKPVELDPTFSVPCKRCATLLQEWNRFCPSCFADQFAPADASAAKPSSPITIPPLDEAASPSSSFDFLDSANSDLLDMEDEVAAARAARLAAASDGFADSLPPDAPEEAPGPDPLPEAAEVIHFPGRLAAVSEAARPLPLAEAAVVAEAAPSEVHEPAGVVIGTAVGDANEDEEEDGPPEIGLVRPGYQSARIPDPASATGGFGSRRLVIGIASLLVLAAAGFLARSYVEGAASQVASAPAATAPTKLAPSGPVGGDVRPAAQDPARGPTASGAIRPPPNTPQTVVPAPAAKPVAAEAAAPAEMSASSTPVPAPVAAAALPAPVAHSAAADAVAPPQPSPKACSAALVALGLCAEK